MLRTGATDTHSSYSQWFFQQNLSWSTSAGITPAAIWASWSEGSPSWGERAAHQAPQRPPCSPCCPHHQTIPTCSLRSPNAPLFLACFCNSPTLACYSQNTVSVACLCILNQLWLFCFMVSYALLLCLTCFMLLVICTWFGWPISLTDRVLECIADCFFSIIQEVVIANTLIFLVCSNHHLFDVAKRGKIRMTMLVCVIPWISWPSWKNFLCYCLFLCDLYPGTNGWLFSYDWSIWSFGLSSSKTGNLLNPSLYVIRFW